MSEFKLMDLQDQLRAIGRATIMFSEYWDGSTPIALEHLADTEGEVELERNDEYSDLVLPELTGPSIHKRFYTGENPVLSIPAYLADPDLRSILSPTGRASAGHQRQRQVKEYTLWVFPEELLFDPTFNDGDGGYGDLSYTTADGWRLKEAGDPGAGEPLSAEKLDLLALGIFFWRGHFQRAPLTFRHEDAGKAVDTVPFQVMQDVSKPDGEQLYTSGDPNEQGIDLDPAES